MKRRSSSPVTSVLLLLTVLFLLPLSCSAKRAPLCHEVLGFAESINHEFILSITAAPREGEAIVLLAHPFPDQEEGLVLNATYRLRTGNSIVTRVADADNVLILTDVAENSEMHVGILRAKTDGPVPFRFVSYHANSPICSIMVSPTHSFSSRVPNRLPNGQVATVFFHANPPASVNAAVIFAHEGTGTRVADGILSFREDPSAMRYTETESGEVLQGDAGQPLHFAFTPDPVSTSNKRLHISLQWAEVVNGGGQKTGKRNTNHPPPQKGGTSFAKVVFVVLVLGFIAATAYNYVVLHKRDVAEVVPLAGFLSTVGDHVMFMARNPRSADRSGYQHMG